MMLPILISVSVAPTSYFFCASAPLDVAAAIARAAEKAASRKWTGILISLGWLNVSIFLIGNVCALREVLNTRIRWAATKSPLRGCRRGRHLVEPAAGAGGKWIGQLLRSPLMMSPNRSHFSPLNRII